MNIYEMAGVSGAQAISALSEQLALITGGTTFSGSISQDPKTATAGQTVFGLTNTSGIIFLVVVNNVPQTLGIGYSLNTGKNTATLSSGAEFDDTVTLHYYLAGTTTSGGSSGLISTDILNGTAAGMIAPWGIANVNGGSSNSNAVGVDAKHPGYTVFFSHASTANSGCYMLTAPTAIMLSGNEKTTFVFKTLGTLTGVTMYAGYHDSDTYLDPVDGAYFKLSGGSLSGNTSNNSTRSATGTSHTLSLNTWYRAVIELNADASSVTFTLYQDDSDTVLWTNALTTNIPKTSGRVLANGITCTLATTSAATSILEVDYLDMYIAGRKLS